MQDFRRLQVWPRGHQLNLLNAHAVKIMQIQVPYGRSFLTASLPDHVGVDVIEAPETRVAADPLGAVRSALDNLLGGATWADFAGARSVAIAVNDKTRPVPHHQLLPPLLERLAALGIPDAAITFYVAVGAHPPMTPDEFPAILPDGILKRYRVVSHDSENDDLLINLGETPGGTPIWSNKAYVGSDFKIVVGNIEPHQFVGFSGGVKSAAIGLAGVKTINHNHALMTHPDSQLGEYENNPARQDVEEIGKKMGIHLALNAILNQNKQIVHVLAGDPRAVMRAGVPLSQQVCQVGVSTKYGLMISSPGGHPKDINIYQAQKGLAHAALITRPGGTIILVAACPEGTGSSHYEDWMLGKESYDEVFERFSAEGFRIGPHKAYQIARDASKTRLLFCSEMDERLSRALLLNPVKDLQTAVDMALPDLQPGERTGVLPHASSTIPYIEREVSKPKPSLSKSGDNQP
jgi:nickel-dependent lactate racemase